MSMPRRFIALLALVCFALSAGGCESFWKDPPGKRPSKSKPKAKSKKQYEEVLMPLQTGSVLQRRAYVERRPDSESKPSKKKKKETAAPNPEAEPSATPTPEEESTPPPVDRFR
jgi:hypothetical protein